MKKQRFELVAGTSAKFWEVAVNGTSMVTTYGRIGSKGQSTTKEFATSAEAKTAAEKLIAEKTRKGYGPPGSGGTVAKPVTKPASAKKSAKKAVGKKAAAKKAAKKTADKKRVSTKPANEKTGKKTSAGKAAVGKPHRKAGSKKPAVKKAPKKSAVKKAAGKSTGKLTKGSPQKAALAKARDTSTSSADLLKLAGQRDAVDRVLAARADAPAKLLEKLSHSSDRTTRRNVAANPNCPTEALLYLAPQFPKEFIANPVFDWILIEDPAIFGKLDNAVLMGLLKQEDCPVAFMKWAADDAESEVQLSLAMNKNAPLEVLETLAKSRNKQVAKAAAGHEKILGEVDPDELEEIFRSEVMKLLQGNAREEIDKKYIGLAQFPFISPQARAYWAGIMPKTLRDFFAAESKGE